MNILDEEPIRIRDCTCPGEPHKETGDLVRLRPKLTAAGGAAIAYIGAAYPNEPIRQNALYAQELLVAGVGWWNLTGEKGKPVPINEQTILEQLDWQGGGGSLYLALTNLYFAEKEPEQPSPNGKVAHEDPLPTSGSSSSGLTEASTSATPSSSALRRRPSRSSSPASTATI